MKKLAIVIFAGLVAAPAMAQPLKWFTDKNAFEAAARAQGKILKGIENYEASVLLPNQVDGFNDTLHFGIPNLPDGFPYPNGTDGLRNLWTQSNNNQNPGLPSPAGTNGLAAASVGFLGATSDIVLSNTFVNGIDFIFDPISNHTAIGAQVLDLLGPQVGVVMTVYDKNEVELGSMIVPANAGGIFHGVIANGTTIGRINLQSGGAEGLDDIQAWIPEPASLSLFVLGGLALLRRRRG